MLACFRGNTEVIKLLIKGGAGTHSRDRVGRLCRLLHFVYAFFIISLSYTSLYFSLSVVSLSFLSVSISDSLSPSLSLSLSYNY